MSFNNKRGHGGGNMSTPYTQVTDRIPAWVVGDTVMAVWASGKEDLPNSFTNWDSPEKEAGMALMMSRGSSCLGLGTDLEGEKVYSALVVFVHPRQELLTIKEGASCLLTTVEQSGSSSSSDVTVLCKLPCHKHGRYYPSTVNHAYLVMPYLGKKGTLRNSVWMWRCVTTAISWFASCTDGKESLVTWRSYHLCSLETPPS